MAGVQLKNGTYEFEEAVQTTMQALSDLWASGIVGQCLVYDLNLICQGKPERVSAAAIAELQKIRMLLPSGLPHDTVKNIVLSACDADGMTLKSPLA